MLIRLRRCTGWSAPLLFENPEDRFSSVEAHLKESVMQVHLKECVMHPLADMVDGIKISELVQLYLYLMPVKTQLLQNNLTQDLMLFYRSNKLKA